MLWKGVQMRSPKVEVIRGSLLSVLAWVAHKAGPTEKASVLLFFRDLNPRETEVR